MDDRRLDINDLTEKELRQVIAELIRHAELVIRRRGSFSMQAVLDVKVALQDIERRVSPAEWSRQMQLVTSHAKTPADFDTVDALIRRALEPIPLRTKWRLLLRIRIDSIIGRAMYHVARWLQRRR